MLFAASENSEEAGAVAFARRRRRRGNGDVERASHALQLVQMVGGWEGGRSAARQALEGAELAPGTLATWRAFTNPDRRPFPEDFVDPQPRVLFNVSEDTFHFSVGEARSCRWP